jgi:hypothetical protein
MFGAYGSERVRRVRGQAKERCVLDGVNEDSLLECGGVS